jgi:transposase
MTAEEERIHLRERNREREEHVKQLMEQRKKRQEHAAKTSQKSSLPPSSDRFARQKRARSRRTKSGKKQGGHAGHQGHTLTMRAEPPEVIPLAPVTRCQHCQADVRSVVQDGPRLATWAVYLTTQQRLPRRRTKEVLGDLLGASMSEGTLTTVITRAAHLLVPVEEQIKAALRRAKVIPQDESGLSVCNRRIWMHVTATRFLTHDQVHRSRGHQAVDDHGILTHFEGTSVHDAWAASFRSDCQQSLCCLHLLRELRFLSQEMGLWWAVKMERVLLLMKRTTDDARTPGSLGLSPPEITDWHARFLTLLDEGDRVHPRLLTPKGKCGRATQHPGRRPGAYTTCCHASRREQALRPVPALDPLLLIVHGRVCHQVPSRAVRETHNSELNSETKAVMMTPPLVHQVEIFLREGIVASDLPIG